MQKKVLVLCGGFSAEREVSLTSGRGIAEALETKGYQILLHDLTSAQGLLKDIKSFKPNVVFNALHGNWGEDGAIQGFLDLLQIPYTHSSMAASCLGMNKSVTKKIAAAYGIKVAESETLTYAQFLENGTQIEFPYVVKPQSDGSSVGVYIVRHEDDVKSVFYKDLKRLLLVEKYIAGRELTVAVINGKACAVTELKMESGFYDYKAKYTSGITRHILPAPIPPEVAQTAMAYAEKIHQVLGCNTVSRSDFRYNEKDGVVFLEINTNPGMTPLSLVPEQAKYIGLSYEDLCQKLVENATCRKI